MYLLISASFIGAGLWLLGKQHPLLGVMVAAIGIGILQAFPMV